jgi:hypothetical protein
MDKKCLCIVMDYADGGDLYTKIANQKKIGKHKSPLITETYDSEDDEDEEDAKDQRPFRKMKHTFEI